MDSSVASRREITLIIRNVTMDREDTIQALRVWKVEKLMSEYNDFLIKTMFPEAEGPDPLSEGTEAAIAFQKKKLAHSHLYYSIDGVHMDHDALLSQCNVIPGFVLNYAGTTRIRLAAFINKHTWQFVIRVPHFRTVQDFKKIVTEQMLHANQTPLWDPSLELKCIYNLEELEDEEFLGKIGQSSSTTDLQIYVVAQNANLEFMQTLCTIGANAKRLSTNERHTALGRAKPFDFYSAHSFDGDWTNDSENEDKDDDEDDDDSSSSRSSSNEVESP